MHTKIKNVSSHTTLSESERAELGVGRGCVTHNVSVCRLFVARIFRSFYTAAKRPRALRQPRMPSWCTLHLPNSWHIFTCVPRPPSLGTCFCRGWVGMDHCFLPRCAFCKTWRTQQKLWTSSRRKCRCVCYSTRVAYSSATRIKPLPSSAKNCSYLWSLL